MLEAGRAGVEHEGEVKVETAVATWKSSESSTANDPCSQVALVNGPIESAAGRSLTLLVPVACYDINSNTSHSFA